MHCGLGEHEKSFTSISLSKVHLENCQVELKTNPSFQYISGNMYLFLVLIKFLNLRLLCVISNKRDDQFTLLICKIYAIIICDALNKLFGGAGYLVNITGASTSIADSRKIKNSWITLSQESLVNPEVPDFATRKFRITKEITVEEYLQKDSCLDLTLRIVSSFLTYSMFYIQSLIKTDQDMK